MQTHPDQDRMSRDAFRLANDLEMDLIAGAKLYAMLRASLEQAHAAEEAVVAFKRICLFHTVIALSKWTELYKHYKAVMPTEVKDVAKRLQKEIDDRGIVTFRHTVAGHVWDDEKKRPLTNDEVEGRLLVITKGSLEDFFAWVSSSDSADERPETVVARVEQVRDCIRDNYHLTDADLHR